MSKAPYTCSVCGKGVIVRDGVAIRGCSHDGAAINLNLDCVLYGESHVRQGHPEALKLMDTTPAEGH